jgi:hypothetical protein
MLTLAGCRMPGADANEQALAKPKQRAVSHSEAGRGAEIVQRRIKVFAGGISTLFTFGLPGFLLL